MATTRTTEDLPTRGSQAGSQAAGLVHRAAWVILCWWWVSFARFPHCLPGEFGSPRVPIPTAPLTPAGGSGCVGVRMLLACHVNSQHRRFVPQPRKKRHTTKQQWLMGVRRPTQAFSRPRYQNTTPLSHSRYLLSVCAQTRLRPSLRIFVFSIFFFRSFFART